MVGQFVFFCDLCAVCLWLNIRYFTFSRACGILNWFDVSVSPPNAFCSGLSYLLAFLIFHLVGGI